MWGIPFIRRCFVSRISGGRLGRWPRIYSNSKFCGVTLKRGRRREVGPHEEFVLTRRTQDAASPKNEKSPVLATIQGTLALIAAAKRMRRLYGSRGGSARQDGSVAADADLSSEDEDDHAARFAYRKATREKDFAKTEDNEGGQGKSKRENGGPSPNGGDRYAPNCLSPGNRGKLLTPSTPVRSKPSLSPYFFIAMESPMGAQNDGLPVKRGGKRHCE